MDDLHINKKLTIPAAALSWSAARASGPGGQHVNKTSTKVELIFDPALCAIADEVVERMRTASPSRFDNDGRVHVVAQDSRSQSTNLETALRRVADLVRAASYFASSGAGLSPGPCYCGGEGLTNSCSNG